MIRPKQFWISVAAVLLTIPLNLSGQQAGASGAAIFVLCDDLSYTLRIPATELSSTPTRVERVLVRVGRETIPRGEPVFTFETGDLDQERIVTRSETDESLRGQLWRVRVTKEAFNASGDVVGVSTVATLSIPLGTTYGSIVADTVWDHDRTIRPQIASAVFDQSGGIRVEKGAKLTIQGDVLIDGFDRFTPSAPPFLGRAPFTVQGRLVVQGTTQVRLKHLAIGDVSNFVGGLEPSEGVSFENVVFETTGVDLHASGTAFKRVTGPEVSNATGITLRPFGLDGELRVEDSTFAGSALTMRPKRVEGGASPTVVVVSGSRFGSGKTAKTLEVDNVPAFVEISGNTFLTSGLRLAVAEGEGFSITGNRVENLRTVPSSGSVASEEFDMELLGGGSAEEGSTRLVADNVGVAFLTVGADETTVRDNVIGLASGNQRFGQKTGFLKLLASSCIVEKNVVQGRSTETETDTSTTGISIGVTGESTSVFDNLIRENVVTGCGIGMAIVLGDGNEITRNKLARNHRNLVLGDRDTGSAGDPVPLPGNRFVDNHVSDPLTDPKQPGFLPLNFSLGGACERGSCTIQFNLPVIESGANIVNGQNRGGNFWSDYTGVDGDGNGIGDTAHELAALSDNTYRDLFPLVEGTTDIIVNLVSDEEDADLSDDVADIDLARPGLQTTLRAAIQTANARVGADTIRFDFTAGGAPTTGSALIQPAAALPSITETVLIDGSSVVGGVQLNGGRLQNSSGQGVGTASLGEPVVDGLTIDASANLVTLRGLVVTGFRNGVMVSGGQGHLIEDCFLGLAPGHSDPSLGNVESGTFFKNVLNGEVLGCVVGNNGVGIRFSGCSFGAIAGNRVGLSEDQSKAPNRRAGIEIHESHEVLVGGRGEGAGNVVVANGEIGIAIEGESTLGLTPIARNLVIGNFVGVLDAESEDPTFGNTGIGVNVTDSRDNRIEGNRIAFNHRFPGIRLNFESERNIILDNSIHDNESLGIAVSANLPDSVALPELSFTPPPEGEPFRRDRITGQHLTVPNGRVRLQVFSNAECDASSFGEGETLMATVDATADSEGLVRFEIPIPEEHLNLFYTATATRLGSDGEPVATSGFSQCLGAIIVNMGTDEPDPDLNDGVADVDLELEGLQTTLRAAIQTANALPGRDVVLFTVGRITTQNALPQIDDPIALEADVTLVTVDAVDGGGAALVFGPDADASLVRNIQFIGKTVGVEVSGPREIVIDACRFAVPRDSDDNSEAGILVSNGGSVIVTRSDFVNLQGVGVRIVDSPGSVVGDELAGETSTESIGNRFMDCRTAVEIVGPGARDNRVGFNQLNLSEGFTAAAEGIIIHDASENLIVSNRSSRMSTPVRITGSEARLNRVQRNMLDGRFVKGAAIVLEDRAGNNTIGVERGQGGADGNVIDGFDVGVGVASGTGNTILGNRFRKGDVKRPLPIDLGFDVNLGPIPTPNDIDPGDANLPNRLQNHPEIVFLSHDGPTLFGMLESAPGETFFIEILGGFGESVLASLQVVTDANGRALFKVDLDKPTVGIVATATNRFGDTSEASPALSFYSVNSPRGDGDTTDAILGDGLNLTGFNLPDGRPECSLRAAIEDANIVLGQGSDARALVYFQIFFEGAQPRIVVRDDALPTIRVPMTLGAELPTELVDGFVAGLGVSRDLFRINPFVDIVGDEAPLNSGGLSVSRSAVHLRNLGVSGFPRSGIHIKESRGSLVEGCVASGNGREGEEFAGILIEGSRDVVIGGSVGGAAPGVFPGNIVHGNAFDGIVVVGSFDTRIEGNLVGMTMGGGISGNREGVRVKGIKDSEIRSFVVGNAIGGNTGNGIVLEDTIGLTVSANRIGFFSESQFAGNGFSGIVVRGDSSNNLIGGGEEGMGNTIVDNARNGIALLGGGVTETRVLGNVVGDPFVSGLKANREAGILIQGSNGNQVGGPGAAGNRILQHPGNGLEILGDELVPVTRNRVQGNDFEANSGAGILLDHAEENLVGPDREQGQEFANRIFAGHSPAIRVKTADDNTLSRNSIFNNLEGIRLDRSPVSHEAIAPPRILGVTHNGLRFRVKTLFDSGRNSSYTFEYFLTPARRSPGVDCRIDGGREFLFAAESIPLGGGSHVREFVLDTDTIPEGQMITVTVTGFAIGTSEFSNCHPVVPFDADGDGRSDLEEAEAGVDPADAGVTAVPNFGMDGEPSGSFTTLSVLPSTSGGKPFFTDSASFPISQSPVPPPEGVEFPFGLFTFTAAVNVPGDNAQFTLKVPENLRINCFYKLARRTVDGPVEWFCLEQDLAVFDFARNEWVVTLTDGQVGDFDLSRDAIIRDPVAPAFDPNQPPLQVEPRLGIVHTPTGAILLQLLGIPGSRYQWQHTARLEDPDSWMNFGDVVTVGANGETEFTDTPGEALRFYRVLELP